MNRKPDRKTAPAIDRRVARTRQLLEDALVALTLEQGYASVTVEDICRRANVGRSTFYAHHAGKADLRKATIEKHLRAVLDEPARQHGEAGDTLFPFILPLLEHAAVHRNAHRATAREDTIHDEVVDRLRGRIRSALLANPERTADVPVEFAAEFLTGAFRQILDWWLQSDRTLTPEEIERLFSQMAKASLASFD